MLSPVTDLDHDVFGKAPRVPYQAITDIRWVYVVSAPSGGGKTTLNRRLCAQHPEIELAISHTTRSQRVGEISGVDYHFTTRNEFIAKVERGEFLEWANVHGYFYGVSRLEIDRISARGHTPLLTIDVQGFCSVQKKLQNLISVFILPPDLETLWARLESRGTDSEATRWSRLKNARAEIARAKSYQYFIINDDRDRAFEEMEKIFFDHETQRRKRAEHDQGWLHCQKLLQQFSDAAWIKALEAKYDSSRTNTR